MVLDSADDVLPSALEYIGENPDSKDAKVIEKGAEVVQKVRPSIRKFHSSENINALANGDICLSLIFSGDAGIAATRAEEAKNGVNIEYVIPHEGAQLWFDMMAIPADAQNVESAYAFINYLLEPEVMAKISNFVTYPNAVPGLAAPDQRGGEGRSQPVPARGAAPEAVRGHAVRSEGPARGDPDVDAHRHRQLTGEPDLGPKEPSNVEKRSTLNRLALTAAAIVLGLGIPALAQEKVVKIYNWSDYIDPAGAHGLHRQDRHPGGLRRLRQQRGARDQAAGRQHRLRSRGAHRLLPRPADPGRDLPAAGQGQDPELEEPRPRADEPGRQVRSRQRARRRSTCGAPPGSATTSTRSRSGCPMRPPIPGRCCSIPRTPKKLADCGIMALDAPDEVIASRPALSGRGPRQQGPGRAREGRGAAGQGPALHPQVPQLGGHQRAGQRRHLPCR